MTTDTSNRRDRRGKKGVSGTLVMKRRGGGGPFSGGVVVTGSSIYRWVSLPRPTYNSA